MLTHTEALHVAHLCAVACARRNLDVYHQADRLLTAYIAQFPTLAAREALRREFAEVTIAALRATWAEMEYDD